MLTTDPIADMLTRIRNAINASQNQTSLPQSKINEAVAKLLKDSGFIDDVKVTQAGKFKSLEIVINQPGTNAKITSIVRLSKPGRRLYASCREIPIVKRGRGIVLVSTSKGLMTGQQAKTSGVGGELICSVY